MAEGILAFPRISRSKFENIRRGVVNPDGQRAEVVQRGDFDHARVYGFVLSGVYPIQSWLSAHLAYRFAYQEQGPLTVHHNVVTLSLDFAYPYRVAP